MASSAGRKRPQPGSATLRVWEIADDLLRHGGGRLPSGREVVDRFVAEGGNEGTGFTQYSHWKKEQVRRTSARHPVHLHIDRNGRVTLPPEFLAEMELGEAGKVTAFLDDGEVRLISPKVGLRRARALVATLPQTGTSVVEEFLAEKRQRAEPA